jgi:RNA polymerase sigma-70 factor (ECF subfamily)
MRMSPTPHFDDLTPAMGRYVGGDRSAFGVIYRRLAPWLRLHLRKLLAGRSDDQLIDDLMQTTFLKLHDLRHTWVKGSPVAPWVLVIARHLAIDELRRHRFAASEQVPEPVASSEPSQHTLLELYELTEAIFGICRPAQEPGSRLRAGAS